MVVARKREKQMDYLRNCFRGSNDSGSARPSSPERSPRLREVSPVIDERTRLPTPTHTDATPETQETGDRPYWKACYEGLMRCFPCLREATTQNTSPPPPKDTASATRDTLLPEPSPPLPIHFSPTRS